MKNILISILLFLFCLHVYGEVQDTYNPENPPEPSLLYEVSIQTSPESGGSLYPSGIHKYKSGESVRLTAYPNHGYRFKAWMLGDSVISNVSTFDYLVTEMRSSLMAVFEYSPDDPTEPDIVPLQHKLNIQAEPSLGGRFNVSSGNLYKEGDLVLLYAYANSGFRFKEWRSGDSIISTSPDLSYIQGKTDATITGIFNYNPGSPEEPNANQNVKNGIIALSTEFKTGSTNFFPIYLLNENSAVSEVKFNISFPADIKVFYQNSTLSSRKNGHYIQCDSIGDNKFHVQIKSDTGQPILESNGVLVNIPILIPTESTNGKSTPVVISDAFITTNGIEQACPVKNGAVVTVVQPIPKISANFSSDIYLNRVRFSNLSSDIAETYFWDFGDGTTSSEKNPLHIYKTSASYVVSLIASNSMVSDTLVLNIGISPQNTWKISGLFTLDGNSSDIKNFLNFSEMSDLLSKAPFSGNVTVQIVPTEIYEIQTDQNMLDNLNVLMMNSRKSGYPSLKLVPNMTESKPVLNFTGIKDETGATTIINFCKSVDISHVDVALSGDKLNLDIIEKYDKITICSETATEKANYTTNSRNLTYNWILENSPKYIAGYQKDGKNEIPSMTLVNSSEFSDSLVYLVEMVSNQVLLYQMKYVVVVRPTLKGSLTNLSPSKNEEVSSPAVSFSWSAIKNAVYDVYLWEKGTIKPEMPLISWLSEIRYVNNSFCEYGKNYEWMVIAKGECRSIKSPIDSFKVRKLPDLHVNSVSCSEAYAGGKMTVSWTVKNDGAGDTGNAQWSDRIWLVPDVYSGTTNTCILLNTSQNVSTLGTGESYQNSADVNISEKVSGNYYVVVVSDMYDIQQIDWSPVKNTVPDIYSPSLGGNPYGYLKGTTNSYYNNVLEVNEKDGYSDNFFYKKVNILIPPLPDLQVTSIIPPDNFYSAKEITVQSTITNMGDADISPNELDWTDRIFVSKTPNFDNTALFLGSLVHDNKTDTTKRNVVYASTGGAPSSGNGIIVPIEVDPVYNGLKMRESYTEKFKVNIPLNLYGTLYFFVLTDVDNVVYEHSNEVNNMGNSNAVNCILTPPADLVPVSVTVSDKTISTGESFTMNVRIENVNSGKCTISNWTDKVYLSKKSTGLDNSAVEISSHIHTGGISSKYDFDEIAVFGSGSSSGSSSGGMIVTSINPSYMFSSTLNLPDLAVGSYYVYVKTDVNEEVFELDNKENNTFRMVEAIHVVKPDLSVEFTSVPEVLNSDQIVSLSWKITNKGARIVNRPISDNLFISKYLNGENAVGLSSYSEIESLNPELSDCVSRFQKIKMPYLPELNGACYLFVKTDNSNSVFESNENNNLSLAFPVTYKFIPLPDLIVSGLGVSSQVLPGEPLTLNYDISNHGRLDETSGNYSLKVFISSSSVLDSHAIPCDVTKQIQPNIVDSKAIPVGGSIHFNQEVTIPSVLQGGSKYLFVVLNKEKSISEINFDNNQASASFYVSGNLSNLSIPTYNILSEIQTGTDVAIDWTVSNLGTVTCSSRKDGIYLSNDATYSWDDLLLVEKDEGTLDPGTSLTNKSNFIVPDKWHGAKYILIVTDVNHQVEDLDQTNNVAAIPVQIELSPIPDLIVSSVTSIASVGSGQSLKIFYKIKNVGAFATKQDKWSDEVYLSTGSTLNKNNDLLLGSKLRIGKLEQGATYMDSMEVSIPVTASGNYNLILYTDAGNVLYENTSENNNTGSSSLLVNKSLPCDLMVDAVSSPIQLVAQNPVEFNWNIKNIGNYQASGNLKDAIYFSKDASWSTDDFLVGYVSGSIDLSPGAIIRRSATGVVNNVPVGSYYIIIRTNLVNSIIESSTDNNKTSSKTTCKVGFPTMDTGTSCSLNGVGYYALSVGSSLSGQTLALELNNEDVLTNCGLYVAYDKVPTVSDYEYASSKLSEYKHEIIIPTLKTGIYYILAISNGVNLSGGNNFSLDGNVSSVNGKSLMTLSSKILQFEITDVTPNQGGNSGRVTSDISGAKFDSIMDFRLRKNGRFIPAESVYFQNQTKSTVTFNLEELPTGTYDVEAELPGGSKTKIGNEYGVVSGIVSHIYTKIIAPSSVRVNARMPFSIEYSNSGSTDVNVTELMLVSVNGHSIGLSMKDLDKAQTQIRIPLLDNTVNVGKPEVLPPGIKGTKTVFVNANNFSPISLKLYVIQKENK